MKLPEIPKGYERLAKVLIDALDQAAYGKGKERHATDEPFEKQGMIRRNKTHRGFCLAQAEKKAEESERLTGEARKREILGIIVYAAGEIITMEDEGSI